MLLLLSLFIGSSHQKWEQEGSEQADGTGSERNQRPSWSSSGADNSAGKDIMKVGLVLETQPHHRLSRIMTCYERQETRCWCFLCENADIQSNHVVRWYMIIGLLWPDKTIDHLYSLRLTFCKNCKMCSLDNSCYLYLCGGFFKDKAITL